MSGLTGRRAVVTGGASGIGRAIAQRLAADGARVVLTDRDEERGLTAAHELGAEFLRIDVADPAQIAGGFGAAAAMLGGLDLVCLNAGAASDEPGVENVSDERYRHVMAVNVDHVVLGAREALGLMSGPGDILVTAGLVGLVPYPPDPIYAMAKHAVVNLVRSLAPVLAERGVAINAICPGVVRTPMLGDQGAAFFEAAGVTVLEPDDVAEAVVGAVSSGRTGESWICRRGEAPAVLGEGVALAGIEALMARMTERIGAFMRAGQPGAETGDSMGKHQVT